MHCDLDLGDMTSGQGHDAPFSHGQQLCELLYRKSGYFCVFLFFANFGKKGIDLFLCFLFLQIHSNTSNKSITIYVNYVQVFLNILFKNTPTGKLFPLLSICSMQTFTYYMYVQIKSNVGRTMFAMVIVYIKKFW